MTSTNVQVEDESVLVPIADVDSIILLKSLTLTEHLLKCSLMHRFLSTVQCKRGKQLCLYNFNKNPIDSFTNYPRFPRPYFLYKTRLVLHCKDRNTFIWSPRRTLGQLKQDYCWKTKHLPASSVTTQQKWNVPQTQGT